MATLKPAAAFIGGPGYSFNRLELAAAGVVSAQAHVVADAHSYATDFYPAYPGTPWPHEGLLGREPVFLGGSQIKYRIFVNGSLVGLGPSRPVIDGLPYLHRFDLTGAIRSARTNVVGVISLGERLGFAMWITLRLEDGTERQLRTGPGWKSLSGLDVFRPVCWDHPGIDHFYKGRPGPGEYPQHIDGRRFPAGWSEPGFDDSSWDAARTFGTADGEYLPLGTANLAAAALSPRKVVRLGDGHYFFDFGREVIAGLGLHVPAGDGSIEVRLGEECFEPNRVRFILRTENGYQEMWHLGDRPLTLEHFGLRGFRYGEVVGWPGEFTADCVYARVVHYPFDDRASDFESSDPVLNDVWGLCKYTIKACCMDIYQDCPTRERVASEGDIYNEMLSHYAVDADTRLARHSAEYLLHHPTWPADFVMCLIPIFWADYMQTGDPALLEKHYEHLRDRSSYHHDLDDGLRNEFPKPVMVDWPASQLDGYEPGPVNTVANAYMYRDIVLLGRMARILGRGGEAQELESLAGTVRTAFNARLLNPATGLYVDHEGSSHSSFHANLYSLGYGLASTDRIGRCIDMVIRKGMAGSVYTSQLLLDTLYKHGQAEHALKLMTARTGNSWGHMIYDLGATTTTEAWDPSQKSNMSWAHAWAATPANIIVRWLFGIRPIEAGWRRFTIDPRPASLKRARITVPTPRGQIHARFEQSKDGTLVLDFLAPEGCVPVVGGIEYADARSGGARVYKRIELKTTG